MNDQNMLQFDANNEDVAMEDQETTDPKDKGKGKTKALPSSKAKAVPSNGSDMVVSDNEKSIPPYSLDEPQTSAGSQLENARMSKSLIWYENNIAFIICLSTGRTPLPKTAETADDSSPASSNLLHRI